jgi:hypothetical protein
MPCNPLISIDLKRNWREPGARHCTKILHGFWSCLPGGAKPLRANTALTVSTGAERANTLALMPSFTESRIDELCARIRAISKSELSPEGETELRKLAYKLRRAVYQHVEMAKSSLRTKKSAIDARDPTES